MPTPAVAEGQRLLRSGQVAAGLAMLADAHRSAPKDNVTLFSYALALLEHGRAQEATSLFQQLAANDSANPQAHAALARALVATGASAKAISALETAVKLDPDNPGFATSLATLLRESGRAEDACALLERHVTAQPAHAAARWEYARSLWASDRLDESERQFKAHLQLQPGNSRSLVALGRVAASRGDIAGARDHLRQALQLAPHDAAAWWEYAHVDPAAIDESAATTVARLAQEAAYPMQRELFEDILARHYDRTGRQGDAIIHAAIANRIRQDGHRASGTAYDPALHDREIDALCSDYSPALRDGFRNAGQPSERPVFIVGMPRSGTTLLERMLAGHTQVCGIGEQMLARQSLHRAYVASSGSNVTQVSPAALRAAATWHLEEVDRRARLQHSRAGASRVIDKLPENYLLVGWLAMTLPNATIIHCQRDARDVAVSCWLGRFAEMPWSFDIDNIASRIAGHRRIMRHWRELLPGRLHEVQYGDLVADPERTLRGLLRAMGLEWDEAVLDFATNEGIVKTASQLQVRQPLNTQGIGRWRAYAEVLAPVRKQLDAIVAEDDLQRKAVFGRQPEA